jgi:hypothetical protein
MFGLLATVLIDCLAALATLISRDDLFFVKKAHPLDAWPAETIPRKSEEQSFEFERL